MNTQKWGVLGAAKIARVQVIPALQQSELCEVAAIASRNEGKAREAADELGIEKAYGSYEAMLADPEIDIIYNPLPNHLHVKWTIRALEAGKHVLCEKPIGVNAAEVRELIAARDRTGMKVAEAFMVRYHPQWLRVQELLSEGRIGTLTSMHGHFSYMNTDAENIRNSTEAAGGALMDIGCYMLMFSRLVFGETPRSVSGLVDRDPSFGTDRLSSGLLAYSSGHATFTSATQQVPHQAVHLTGSKGRIEVEIPVNSPHDVPTRLYIDDAGALDRSGVVVEELPPANQFTLQGDDFSRTVAEDREVRYPLEDSLANMAVIDAVFESAERGVAVDPREIMKG